jgi:hypothetical protein
VTYAAQRTAPTNPVAFAGSSGESFNVAIRSALRFASLLVLCAVTLGTAGCHKYVTTRNRFWKVVATDIQGEVIAEWTAATLPLKITGGYKILAIEKRVYTPHFIEYRYAIGRKVEVLAPNVSVFRVPAPGWMNLSETQIAAAATRTTVVTESGK